MSEIGKINLDLQEQANELGYSTVQEAIDAGYVVLYIKPDIVKLVPKEEYELREAHKAWLHEKETIINKLSLAAAVTENEAIAQVLEEAKDFIEKGEV